MRISLFLFIILFAQTKLASAGLDGLFLDQYAADERDVTQRICDVRTLSINQSLYKTLELGEKKRFYRYGNIVLENQTESSIDMMIKLLGHGNPVVSGLNCNSVNCVLTSLLTKKELELLKYLYLKYKIIASHYADKESQRWSMRELNLIVYSLDNLPQYLLPLNKYFKITRHDQNNEPFGFHTVIGSSDGFGNIKFYNYWDRISDARKIYAITHELAHTLGSSLQLHMAPEWNKISASQRAVSEYGETDQLEDFAESFSAYRYNPEYLQRKSKKKYEYFKELLFMGVEYKETNCKNIGHFYSNVDSLVSLGTDDFYQSCSFELLGYDIGRKPLEDVITCFNKNYSSIKVNIPFEKMNPKNKYGPYREQLSLKFNYPAFYNGEKKIEKLVDVLAGLEVE